MAKQAQLDEVRPSLNKVNRGATRVNKVLDAVEAGADKATDILEDGLEIVTDVVPETLDKGVHVAAEGVRTGTNALTSPKRMAILIGVGGAVAGAGLGVAAYFALKRKLEKKLAAEFDERMERELEDIKAFYARRNKGEGFETPAEAAVRVGAPLVEAHPEATAAGEAAAEYAGDQPPVGVQPEGADPREGKNAKTPYHKIAVSKVTPSETVVEVTETTEDVVPEGEVISRNVFDARRISGWDQEREEAGRNEMLPYVISIAEHNDNLYEHEQNTLTYYVPDDMLLDERDQPIEDVEDLVGSENLKMFGHGSDSPDTVYIRNEVKEMDLEILRREDSYAQTIFSGTT